jgi:hypothetical protein
MPGKNLFSQKSMRAMQRKPETKKKIYTPGDVMPVHGKYYRIRLSTVARLNPEYFQWWMDTCKPELNDELKSIISTAKFLFL